MVATTAVRDPPKINPIKGTIEFVLHGAQFTREATQVRHILGGLAALQALRVHAFQTPSVFLRRCELYVHRSMATSG